MFKQTNNKPSKWYGKPKRQSKYKHSSKGNVQQIVLKRASSQQQKILIWKTATSTTPVALPSQICHHHEEEENTTNCGWTENGVSKPPAQKTLP